MDGDFFNSAFTMPLLTPNYKRIPKEEKNPSDKYVFHRNMNGKYFDEKLGVKKVQFYTKRILQKTKISYFHVEFHFFSLLQICSYLLRKSLTEKIIFCAMWIGELCPFSSFYLKQKQSSGVVLWKRLFQKFHKIYRKIPLFQSLCSMPSACSFIKKDIRMCLLVNFAIFSK